MPGTAEGEPFFSSVRLVLYHKQATSARTRFLRFAYESICAFEPLPASPVPGAGGAPGTEPPSVIAHPSPLLARAEHWLGLPGGSLEAESGFRERVEAPGGPFTVYLARFTTIDPPFEAAARVGGSFVGLIDALDLPRAELTLLHRAYALIMED